MANLSLLVDPPMRPIDYAERFLDKSQSCEARGDVEGKLFYERLVDTCLKLERTLKQQKEARRGKATETGVCACCGGSR